MYCGSILQIAYGLHNNNETVDNNALLVRLKDVQCSIYIDLPINCIFHLEYIIQN